MTDKALENRLRRKASRRGMVVRKSRRRDPDAYGYGLYAVIDLETGGALHAHGPIDEYVLGLDDVESVIDRASKSQ